MTRKFQAVESICSGGLSHVPSQPAVVPSLRGVLSRNQSLRNDIRNSLATSGDVFVNPSAPVNSVSTSHRVKHPWNLDATFRNPVQSSTGRPVDRSEEQNRDTIPTLRFAMTSSARNSLFPVEGGYPQNYVVDQQKTQILELHFDKFLAPSTFSCWKIRFKTEVCSCCNFTTETILCIKEVEMADSVDDLKSSHSIQGQTNVPNLGLLDARIASALNKIIQNSYFKKKVSLEEQQAQKEDRFLRGRQIA